MTDQDYMKLALNIAASALGQTSPNPAVGAVVVKNNEIIGMGAHLKAGEPHAEVHAIRMAQDKAEGATIYVTLEPCSHHGKTPPCADLIIQSGIKRVVIATTDPNPLVAGQGIAKLRPAGINVELGLMKAEADELNKVFFHYMTTGTPYVTLKAAMSLDGKIATRTGDSKWISSEVSRAEVHQQRRRHDAILVGVGTVLADNPSLTVRLEGGAKQPKRIILDTHLRTPLEATVVTDGLAETMILTGHTIDEAKASQMQEKGVSVIQLPDTPRNLDQVLTVLAEAGVTSVYVEGGAEVHGQFLQKKAFQELILYIAPKLIGGRLAPTAFGGEGFAFMTEVLDLEIMEMERSGPDIKLVARPRKE